MLRPRTPPRAPVCNIGNGYAEGSATQNTAVYFAPPELSGITTNVIPVGCKGSVRRTLPVARRLSSREATLEPSGRRARWKLATICLPSACVVFLQPFLRPRTFRTLRQPRTHFLTTSGVGWALPSRLQHWRAQIQSRTIPCGLKIKNYSFLFSQAGQLVILGK